MRPVTGNYKLTRDGQPGVTMTVRIDDFGMHTTFGLFEWIAEPSPGMFFRSPGLAVRFLTDTVGVAEYQGGHSFTYAPMS